MKNLYKLVNVYYNIRLRNINVMNSNTKDGDYYNLINLSHIFEDSDTLEPWTCELEGLDGQENDWLKEALVEEEQQATIDEGSNFKYYNDDDLYRETHATNDVYANKDVTRDIASVSGSGTVGRIVREIGSDDDSPSGHDGDGDSDGDPIIIGRSLMSCEFIEYDFKFIST